MKIQDATVLVTGANRGIGKALAEEALARGARKVYAAARNPEAVTTPGVVPVELDITDPAQIAELAERLTDVDVVVNNAGVTLGTSIVNDDLEKIRREMEVNYFGPLQVSRAFAATLTAREGHLLIVNSALSWAVVPGTSSYAATKAASWMLANGLRLELSPKVGVTSLHVGYVDTDMAAHVTGDKVAPDEVAREAFDGIESGAMEVLVDGTARQVKSALSLDPSAIYGS
ncbi:SDR family NAD(P)-dependent oxidoreductase [Herbidospora sp. NEAU-GS84]|uniref:SDR family NAD(P)-dependent oxidoreductase n=1 Tax=Herbidospora solisilvae TaxID=2696284 RepID=A0A7C9N4C6_9ACTN|nr:SDR family oxidoreductase [Herbidospora solisilvae]NAS24094.1 SDR family NAD(P)-dependent oxidoreductase [Herbidospora solisilvae]